MKYPLVIAFMLFSLTVFSQGSNSIWGDTSKPESYVKIVPFDPYKAELKGNQPMPFDVPIKLTGKVHKSIRKVEIFYVNIKNVEIDDIYFVNDKNSNNPIPIDSLFENNRKIVTLNTKNVQKEIARKVKNSKTKKKKIEGVTKKEVSIEYEDFSEWSYESSHTFPVKDEDSSYFLLNIDPVKANESYLMLIRFGYEVSSETIRTTILKLLEKDGIVPDEWFDFSEKREEIKKMDSLLNDKELDREVNKKFSLFKDSLTKVTAASYNQRVGEGDFKKKAIEEVNRKLKEDDIVLSEQDIDKLSKAIDDFFSTLEGSALKEYSKLLVEFKYAMADLDFEISKANLDALDSDEFSILADSNQDLYGEIMALKAMFSRNFTNYDTYYPSIFVPYKDNIYFPKHYKKMIGDSIKKSCLKGVASIQSVRRSKTRSSFLSSTEENYYNSKVSSLNQQLAAVQVLLNSKPQNDTLERKVESLRLLVKNVEIEKVALQEKRRRSYSRKVINELVILEDHLFRIHSMVENTVDELYQRKSTFWQQNLKNSIADNFSGLSIIPVESKNYTTGNYITRAPYYISADFGFAGFFFKDANNERVRSIQPYLGVNFNLFPINKNAPYNLFSRSFEQKACNYWRNLFRGTSVVVGLSIDAKSFLKGGNTSEPSIIGTYNDNNYLISGLGIRLNDFVRLSGGVVWYRYRYTNVPDVTTNYRLSVGPYVSLSLDWDVRSFTGKLGQTINQIFK